MDEVAFNSLAIGTALFAWVVAGLIYRLKLEINEITAECDTLRKELAKLKQGK